MLIVMGGIQWGDEGKGKLTDYFAEKADIVVRVNGGANAGHSLEEIVTHLVPSGVLRPQAQCFLGNDMVVDPLAFDKEVKDLQNRGFLRCKRLGISPLLNLVMPYCLELERLRERARGKAAIGTTGRGIGPTYELRARRLGIRAGDLLHLEKLAAYVATIVAEINPEICHWGGKTFSSEDVFVFLEQSRKIMEPFILRKPLSQIICQAVDAGKKILVELAQGSELDIVHGTYPYVTSSSTIAGAACSGLGIGPCLIDRVLGVTKAYATRVGNGPFLSKIQDADLAEKLRQKGGEFGASTGRPRDVGWVDIPQLRHAVRINGLTGLVITKADVLAGFKPMICTHYRHQGRNIQDLDEISSWELADAQPVFEELAGFSANISGCTDWDSLPEGAKEIFCRIQQAVGVPITVISLGKERDKTILLQNPWQ